MLTITQKFMLLGMKQNKYFGTNSHIRLALVTAGLMDLEINKIIEIKDNKVSVIKDLPSDLDYLITLYQFIAKKDSIKLTHISQAFAFKNKDFKQLKKDVENSLTDKWSLKESVIEEMRDEFLSDSIRDETIILAVLLHKTRQLKMYFSKHEVSSIKDTIKQLKKENSNKILTQMINNIDALNVVIVSSVM